MLLNEYQNRARTTARYPNVDSNLFYPIKGLIGEIGEVANKLKKLERDDNNILTPERKNDIVEEIGDQLWYVAMFASELKIKLSDIVPQCDTFDQWTHNGFQPSCSCMSLNVIICKVSSALGNITNNLASKSDRILNYLQLYIYWLVELCKILDIDLTDAAIKNLAKLADRQDRGVVKGSGDRR